MVIGATTGFVIGITSAGSGTVIAILLIAVYRLAPKKVVGTDVFHAAILLWAAGIAHWVGGNVDFRPRRQHPDRLRAGGSRSAPHFSDRAPTGFMRTALGVVLVARASSRPEGRPHVWPIAAAVAAIGLGR